MSTCNTYLKEVNIMTNNLTLNSNLIVSTANLDSYIQGAYALPVLSREDEQALAIDLRDNENLDAAKQLVLHNLRFVIQVARGYNGYGLPLADLIQEGNIGLMKAVKRFDPDVKVRVVSFAVHWIRAEIHEYVLRNWRIVKVATTKAQRKLFFNLRSKKKRLAWLNDKEVNAVAKELGVKPKEVMEMESRLTGRDIGFDMDDDSDDESAYIAPAGYLTHEEGMDPSELYEAHHAATANKADLMSALDDLDERSRDILARRWLNEDSKSTLQDLGDEYGISAERIRQIEKQAMGKMREAIAA